MSDQGAEMPEGTFNVRDFGAVGDGIHDDTEAIAACFQAAWAYEQMTGETEPDKKNSDIHTRVEFPPLDPDEPPDANGLRRVWSGPWIKKEGNRD